MSKRLSGRPATKDLSDWGMKLNESINLMYSKMGTCCPASDSKFFINTPTESYI